MPSSAKHQKRGNPRLRLSPPFTPEQSAELSACFIRDVAATIEGVAAETGANRYAVYTPVGSEADLQPLLPERFALLAQSDGDLGARLTAMMQMLFSAGHRGVILVGSDGPTLPHAILRDAVAFCQRDNVVISPAHDGGYNLIGLSQPHQEIFRGIAWSTPQVYSQTRQRVSQLGLTTIELPRWYDVDDADGLRTLEAELAGQPLPFARPGLVGAPAHATRAFLAQRRHAGVSLVS